MLKSSIVLCAVLFASASPVTRGQEQEPKVAKPIAPSESHEVVYSLDLPNLSCQKHGQESKRVDRYRSRTYKDLAEYENCTKQLELEALQLQEKLEIEVAEFDEKIEVISNISKQADLEIAVLIAKAKDIDIIECIEPIEQLYSKNDGLIEEMNACADDKTTIIMSNMYSIVTMTGETLDTLHKIKQNICHCSDNVKKTSNTRVKSCLKKISVEAANVVSIANEKINAKIATIKGSLKTIRSSLKTCSLDAATNLVKASEEKLKTAETCVEKKVRKC